MAASKMNVRGAIGAAAAVVLIARARDARHLPRLVLQDGSAGDTLKAWSSALAIFGYERLIGAILRRVGLTRMPSTLAAMLSLFAALRATQRCAGRDTSDRCARLLQPGVDFLGKWMGLFLAPPLVSLDASVAALPPYGGGVWANTVALLAVGWAATHSAAAAVATHLSRGRRHAPAAAPAGGEAGKGEGPGKGPGKGPGPVSSGPVSSGGDREEEVPQDEAVRRAWSVLAALGYLGASCLSVAPTPLRRPIGMLCEASTTVSALALSKLLPDAAQRVLHPLVVCAVTSNLASRYVGLHAPYFDAGRGVGDRLFQWLPAAVTGLGVRMYNTTGLWLDEAEDFRCVLITCTASGCFSMLATSALAVAPQSPLRVPPPLSLPLLHRSVMSALGIEGSQAIGPECDPKLAVASILITGCVGASLGNTLLAAAPAVFDVSSPLVRGVAMGCSAHSIGTAGLISGGDAKAAAISGASMCLAGTVHTLLLQLPGLVPAIRGLAGLPPA